ncbi:MAG: glycyl-radical enzyme activating protein [Bacteroidales bacterium]|nr:glycyl-radical enzyme activating protein [Bacteroidales bacterium]
MLQIKGTIFDIRSFSLHDGPGIRTTIFFKGCPLCCAWCHNPEGQKVEIEKINCTRIVDSKKFPLSELVGYEISVAQLMQQLESDRPFFEQSQGGITLSGGEPLLQSAFCKAVLQAAEEQEIHTALDTCGFATNAVFADVAQHAKLVLYDLKIIDLHQHRLMTAENNDLILKNLEWLSKQSIPIFIRIPLIQNITDTEQNIHALRQIIEKTPHIESIDLLPYHQFARNKYKNLNLEYTLSELDNYPKEKAEELQFFFKNSAPRVTIGG